MTPGSGCRTRDVVVVGASAGGVEALRTLAAGLPADFPAAVLVVLHVPPTSTSALPIILSRSGRLPAREAGRDDRLTTGEILVAAPNHHLLVYDGFVTSASGPRENGHRPSIDVLFRSAARSFGARVVGVVLSGTLDDGAAGLIAVRACGGVAVVQDPADALHPSLPLNAIRLAHPEHVVPAADIPGLLVTLVHEEVEMSDPTGPSRLMEMEAITAGHLASAASDPDGAEEPSGLSCPECGGALFTLQEGGLTRFRCRVGHGWSPESLVAQQSSAVESALYMALRSLEERAALTGDMSARAAESGHERVARALSKDHREARDAAVLLREVIDRLTEREFRVSGHYGDSRADVGE